LGRGLRLSPPYSHPTVTLTATPPMLDVGSIRPLGTWLFIEPIVEYSQGGIIIPPEALERYPQAGFILAKGSRCSEDIRVGDIAVLVNEGVAGERTYYQVCTLKLKDWPDTEHFHLETFEQFLTQLHEYQRNPSTADKQLHAKTVEDTWLSFLTSDIEELNVSDVANPMIKLDYVHTQIIHLDNRMFYFAREQDILTTVEWPHGSSENPSR
jgi:co-chaperonin GroES (HSP10)